MKFSDMQQNVGGSSPLENLPKDVIRDAFLAPLVMY